MFFILFPKICKSKNSLITSEAGADLGLINTHFLFKVSFTNLWLRVGNRSTFSGCVLAPVIPLSSRAIFLL